MKNGNALLARIEELNRELADLTTLALYRKPIPDEIDFRPDKAVKEYMDLPTEERETFHSSLTAGARSLFGIYGHRAATRAYRSERRDLLLLGLIASAIANYAVPDNRRLETGLAIYYHVARSLSENPADLFVIAADYATADLVAQFITFGNRDDVTLRQFGWKEVNSEEGIQFRYDWK